MAGPGETTKAVKNKKTLGSQRKSETTVEEGHDKKQKNEKNATGPGETKKVVKTNEKSKKNEETKNQLTKEQKKENARAMMEELQIKGGRRSMQICMRRCTLCHDMVIVNQLHFSF